MLLDCPYIKCAITGCDVIVKKSEIGKHLTENVAEHLLLLNETTLELMRRVKVLEEENDRLRKALSLSPSTATTSIQDDFSTTENDSIKIIFDKKEEFSDISTPKSDSTPSPDEKSSPPRKSIFDKYLKPNSPKKNKHLQNETVWKTLRKSRGINPLEKSNSKHSVKQFLKSVTSKGQLIQS